MLIKENTIENANTAVKCDSLPVWHERLAHQNVAHVKRFSNVRNIPYTNEQFQCEPCIYGKYHRLSFQEH